MFGDSDNQYSKINPLSTDRKFKSTERNGGRSARQQQEFQLKVQGRNRAVTPNQIRLAAKNINETPIKEFTTEPVEESNHDQKQKQLPEIQNINKKAAIKPTEYLLTVQQAKPKFPQNLSNSIHKQKQLAASQM